MLCCCTVFITSQNWKKWFKSIGNKCSAECHSSMQFSPIKKYVELLCESAYETHSTKKYDKTWILSLSYPFNSVYWVFSTSNGILFLISFVMLLNFYGLPTFHCHYRTIQCRKYCGGCNISLQYTLTHFMPHNLAIRLSSHISLSIQTLDTSGFIQVKCADE